MSTRAEVYAAIDGERDYQLQRALQSGKSGEALHTTEEFALYMHDYMQEAIHQLSRTWTADGRVPDALHTIRKITALGVACMEQNGAPRRIA